MAGFGCPERRPELFIRGTEPTEVCPTRFATWGHDESDADDGRRPRRRGIFDLLLDILQ